MAVIMNLADAEKDITALAIEKLETEIKEYKGDRYGDAVKPYVSNTLRKFCEDNKAFAEVFYKTKHTLSDCLKEVMKGCGSAISDIEVYRRVARFYFPNSEVEFIMQISITGEKPDENYLNREAPKPKKKAPAPKPKKEEPKKVEKKPNKKPDKKKAEVIQLSLF